MPKVMKKFFAGYPTDFGKLTAVLLLSSMSLHLLLIIFSLFRSNMQQALMSSGLILIMFGALAAMRRPVEQPKQN